MSQSSYESNNNSVAYVMNTKAHTIRIVCLAALVFSKMPNIYYYEVVLYKINYDAITIPLQMIEHRSNHVCF